jgi:hypothetical protein
MSRIDLLQFFSHLFEEANYKNSVSLKERTTFVHNGMISTESIDGTAC